MFDNVATRVAYTENLNFVLCRLGYLFLMCHSFSPLNFFNTKFLAQECPNLAESCFDGTVRQVEFLCNFFDSPHL